MSSFPAFCPRAEGTRLVRAVPSAHATDNVRYVRTRAWGYPGQRWLRGRELLWRELERAGVRVSPIGLGCGSFGCAYPVENDPSRVVKITGDFSEAAAAQTVILARARGATFPALVHYHCVYGVRGAPMYALLQERLHPLSAPERAFFREAQREIGADAGESGLFDLAFERHDTTAEALLRRMAKVRLGAHGEAQVGAVLDTLRKLRSVGVSWYDLHSGNLLRDASGAWKIIDLGVSVAPSQRVPRLGDALGGFFSL